MACCIGVFEVPGLTAVNGPVFISDVKELTKMFLLVGFLWKQGGILCLISDHITRMLNLQGIPQISTPCDCKLTLCIPVVYMPSVCALGSSRQNKQSANLSLDCKLARPDHSTGVALERGMRRRHFSVFRLFMMTKKEWGVHSTWKCSVYFKGRHAGNFIFCSCTVNVPIAGFV